MRSAVPPRTDGPALRIAWSAHLRRFPWSHYVTLTCTEPRTPDQLSAITWRFMDTVAEAVGGPFWFAFRVEGGGDLRVHVHALLGGAEQVPDSVLRQAWRAGRVADIQAYDRSRRAVEYVTKDIGRDDGDASCEVSPHLRQSVQQWRAARRRAARRAGSSGTLS